MKAEFFYRYDYQPGEYAYESGELFVREFVVAYRTPKGAWIVAWPYTGKKRFVLDSAKKKFAYPSLGIALESYIARKRRHISILNYEIENAKRGLELAIAKVGEL